MVLDRDARSRALGAGYAGSVVVQTAGSEFAEARTVTVAVQLVGIAKAGVVACAVLSGDEVLQRGEFIPTLVGPALSLGPAFAGGICQSVPQVGLNLCLPGVLVGAVGKTGRLREDRLAHEVVQGLSVGAIRGISVQRGGTGVAFHILGLHGLESEFLKAQHLHVERLGSIEGAGSAS